MKLNLYVGYTLLVLLFVTAFFVVHYTFFSHSTNSNPVVLPEDCPNVLLRRGKQLMLINTRRPKIDGVNPIHLKSLDDYVAYAKQQNIILNQSCPILFLQQERDGRFTKMNTPQMMSGPHEAPAPSPDAAAPSPAPAPDAVAAPSPAPDAAAAPSPAYDPVSVNSVTPPFSSHYQSLSDTDFANLINYTASAPAIAQTQYIPPPQPQPQQPQQQQQQQHIPTQNRPLQMLPPQQQQQQYIPTQQPQPQPLTPIPLQLNNPIPTQPFSQVTQPFPSPPTIRPYIVPSPPPPPQSPIDEYSHLSPVPYVDASRDDSPFNQFMYTGFDPINLHAGV